MLVNGFCCFSLFTTGYLFGWIDVIFAGISLCYALKGSNVYSIFFMIAQMAVGAALIHGTKKVVSQKVIMLDVRISPRYRH